MAKLHEKAAAAHETAADHVGGATSDRAAALAYAASQLTFIPPSAAIPLEAVTPPASVVPASPAGSFAAKEGGGVEKLKGKKIGYTGPQSTTQASALWALSKLGYKPDDVTLVSTGGFGPDERLMPADGMLYLGGAETVLGITDRFKPLEGQRGLYVVADGGASGLRRAAG